MNTKESYKIAAGLSILYVIFVVTSIFINITPMGFLFMLFIFPYILLKLRQFVLFIYDDSFISKMLYITIFSIIVSTALNIIIIMTFDKGNEQLAYRNIIFTNVLLLFRGMVLFLSGFLLCFRFREFSTTLKLITIFFSIYGFHSILGGIIGVYSKVLTMFKKDYLIVCMNFLKYSLPLIQIGLFGCLGYLFLMIGKEKNDRNANSDICIRN